jgi:hypothetical protein
MTSKGKPKELGDEPPPVPLCPPQQSLEVQYSWSCALLEEPPILQLLKDFPAFYGTRKFITVLKRVLL